jgi:hypothetical protein
MGMTLREERTAYYQVCVPLAGSYKKAVGGLVGRKVCWVGCRQGGEGMATPLESAGSIKVESLPLEIGSALSAHR